MPTLTDAQVLNLRRAVGHVPADRARLEVAFRDSNLRRSLDASENRVVLAKRALAQRRLSELEALVCRARVNYPRHSIAELAEELGRTKASVWSALRRATAGL